jgi:hypothetical protein
MKMNKTISLIVGTLAILIAACEPIEKRDTLSNSFDPNDIDLEVVQSTAGGNGLTLKMNTPGIAGYWDYVIDKKYTDRVEVVFPIPGTSTFTFHVTTPYIESGDIGSPVFDVKKSIDVTITQLDQPLPEAYYKLVGENLEGKTWVFNGTGGDLGLWWYMSDPGNWQGLWWNAGGTCCPPSDAGGKMVFDLDGGANFTYYASASGTGVPGSSWAFNADFTKLTIKGDSNILGSEGCGANGKVFEIKEFTADKLTLFVSNGGCSTGWVWIFVPAL